MIEIVNLEKSYGNKKILNDITLNIGIGIFGVLGSKGAGKTTLLKIIATLVRCDSGSVSIYGMDIRKRKEIRNIIGYLPQIFDMYPSISVYEAMDYLGILSGLNNRKTRHKKIEEILEMVNLQNDLKTKIKVLSNDKKKRLGIAQAVLHNPKVLLIDEPTDKLENDEKLKFVKVLKCFLENRIVLISTSRVEDIENLCNNIAVIKDGKLLYSGDTKKILNSTDGFVWTMIVEQDYLDDIKMRYIVVSSVPYEDKFKVRLISKYKPFEGASLVSSTMKDGYIKLVKGGVI
jgi:ABC-2 type transport system ATP-binding protein